MIHCVQVREILVSDRSVKIQTSISWFHFCSDTLAHVQGDEWEEKWGERYGSAGWANKYADKWAKDGPNVWHERWGEDYDGGGGCVKYTDKVGTCHRDLNIKSAKVA